MSELPVVRSQDDRSLRPGDSASRRNYASNDAARPARSSSRFALLSMWSARHSVAAIQTAQGAAKSLRSRSRSRAASELTERGKRSKAEDVQNRARRMSRPFVLVQLSDPHIGAAWGDADPVSMYTAAVDAVRSLRLRPDALLVSGDLADTASDVEYQALRELTEPLDVPVYVVAGNHDDRQALHRHFGVPGANGEPVQYSVDLGPARLLVLDSKREGADSGELDADRLADHPRRAPPAAPDGDSRDG
jgi:Calcineurin-like phosphoesterase